LSILILGLALILLKFIWNKRRFIYLTSKIPLKNFSITTGNFSKLFHGEGKVFFDLINETYDGTALTQTFLGHMMTINVVSTEDVQIVFNSKYCVDKPRFMKEFPKLTQGTLFGHLEPWQSHRRILNPYFSIQALRPVIPIFNEKVNIFMQKVKVMVGKDESNIFHHISALMLETFLTVMELENDIQNQEGEKRDSFINNLEM
jgi:cytochrome P450